MSYSTNEYLDKNFKVDFGKNFEIEAMAEIIGDCHSVSDYDCDKSTCAECKARRVYEAGWRKLDKEDLIDKIASYFEEDENWRRLKRDTWLMNGRSNDFRRMLRESLR